MGVKMDIAGELERVNRDIDDMIAHGKKEMQLSFFGGSAEEAQLVEAAINVIKARGFEHELDYEDGEIWLTVRRKRTSNMKYQITIKDLETEEIVFSEECDAVIGGIAREDEEATHTVSGRSFAATHATVAVCLGAAESADQAVETLRKKVADDFILGLAKQIKEESK